MISSIKTKAEALERISVLSDEIDANELENRFNQQEIDMLYAQIDSGAFH